jgi:hypothetical protein
MALTWAYGEAQAMSGEIKKRYEILRTIVPKEVAKHGCVSHEMAMMTVLAWCEGLAAGRKH